ncbi:MAG: type I-E CRISPR-associated protein Cas7/Cse4/CasC [Anaerolineae bacterium]
MLIQMHLLQNYAPANLNRDDTGSPKDALFGGVRRGRISSQCLKRSLRRSDAFTAAFEADGLLGKRTKALPYLIEKELTALGADPVEAQAIVARVPEIGRESTKGGADKSEGDEDSVATAPAVHEAITKQLIFLGCNELRPLAEHLLALYRGQDPKKWAKTKIDEITKALGKSLPRSVDIAMFGRMTTSEAFENVQAAVQVAHALSTNALVQEFDYYTAVDDLSGESGAGMIGDIEFNSSTYYKYLNVHWEQLCSNLGGDVDVARRAVLALLEAVATAQPTGKQNTFAAHSLPEMVLVEVRDRNLPVSYANAFLKPARQGVNGDPSLMDASVTKLADYIERVTQAYDLNSARAYLMLGECQIPGCERTSSLRALGTWLATQLPGA